MLAIGVVVKNGLARVASGGEEIQRAGELEARRPGHNGNIVLDAGRTCQGKVYCVSLTRLWNGSAVKFHKSNGG